jgi:imidazolonepropionase-like amidohydrolase
MRPSRLAALAAALPLMAQAPPDPGPIAIRGARIVPVKGAVVPKGTILIDRGFIQAVGAEVKLPEGTWVLEGEGLTVYPGLMDALSDLGFAAPAGPAGMRAVAAAPAAAPPAPPVNGPEDRPASTPWLRAADEFKADDKRFEQWRQAGFTAVFTSPRTGLLPGQGAVLLTAGARPSQMVLKPGAGLLVSFQPQPGTFPASLMGVHAYLRQTFEDARHARTTRSAGAFTPLAPHDRTLVALNQALGEGQAVWLPATTPVQMDRALTFARDLGLRPVLSGLQQAYAAVDLLKGARAGLVVNAKWPARDKEGDPEADDNLRTLKFRESAPSSPGALEKAGVAFAFGGGDQSPADFLKAVRKAVECGLSPEAALRALTLGPAEVLGVADRVGTLEPGKLANLVVTRGDLLQEKTKVAFVFVAGVKFEVPDRPEEGEKGGRRGGVKPTEGPTEEVR